MHRDIAPRRVLARLRRVPALVVGLAIAGLLLAAGVTIAAWQVTATASMPGASITTGSLKIDSVDETGKWTLSEGGNPAASFDPSTTALKANQTLTYTTNVNVTAIGDSLEATLTYNGGASIPSGLMSSVTVDVKVGDSGTSGADGAKISGAASENGNQSVPVTVTVTAAAGMPKSPDQINLTNLQLVLSNGASWKDNATLNAGAIAVYNGVDLDDAGYVATYDLSLDSDKTIALYLTDPDATIYWDAKTAGAENTGATGAGPIRYWHTYTGTGTVQVAIKGTFKGIGSADQTAADAEGLVTVDKWTASTKTFSAAYAYKNATNAFAQDDADTRRFPAPPTTVTDMTGMFQGASKMYAVAWGWDTSNVTNMSHMFDGATLFASMESVAAWSTANVTDMSHMFAGTTKFEGNLSSWNTSNVTSMQGMFQNATGYSGYFPIGGWDVSKVTDMSFMFAGATQFNSPIGSWKTGNVTTMNSMFKNAGNFAQDLSCWDVSKVTNHDSFRDGNGNLAFVSPGWGGTPGSYCIVDPGSGPLHLLVDTSKSATTTLHLTGAKAVINWGDGTSETATLASGESKAYSHTYTGSYVRQWPRVDITISGTLEGFGSATQTAEEMKNLVEVADWGGTYISSGDYAFRGTSNLTTIATIPQTMKTVRGMFQDSTCALGYIGNWDTSHVTNMSMMFQRAKGFNNNLPSWDTSHVTDMSYMFDDATAFVGTVYQFDTRNVTTMKAMFRNTPFNATVESPDWNDHKYWRTSKVTDMSQMFEGATKFNQNISTWDVSNVQKMSSMFKGATSFNQTLNAWNVQNVQDMSSMFQGATSFNQDINTWAVYNVLTMASMFQGATSFTAENGNLGYWYPMRVTDMSHMFDGASLAKENGGIGFWNVEQVTDFSYMFANSDFNGYNIANWPVKTGVPVNMSHMFYNATEYDRPLVDAYVDGVGLQTLDVSSVTDMSSMFEGATSFNQPLASWGTGNVTTMSRMFAGATSMVQDLRCWDVSKVTDHTDFKLGNGQAGFLEPFWPGVNDSSAVPGCPVPENGDPMVLAYSEGIATLNLTNPDALIYWADGSRSIARATGASPHEYTSDTANAGQVKVYGSFTGFGSPDQTAEQMGNLRALESWGTTGITSAANAFRNATSLTKVPNSLPSTITNLSGAFAGATSFGADDTRALEGWDVSRVTTMSWMFHEASSFKGHYLSGWVTKGVTDMSHMFDGAGLASDVGGIAYWDVSNVTDFSYMFANTNTYPGNGLARWTINTNKPVTMSHMFFDAKGFNNALSGATYGSETTTYTWNVSAVTDMSYMFAGATAFNGALADWSPKNVTLMNHMFEGAMSFNQNIGTWDVSNVTNMAYMFGDAKAFNQVLSGWMTSSVQNMEGMFFGATAMNQDLSRWNVAKVTSWQIFADTHVLSADHWPKFESGSSSVEPSEDAGSDGAGDDAAAAADSASLAQTPTPTAIPSPAPSLVPTPTPTATPDVTSSDEPTSSPTEVTRDESEDSP